MIDFILLMHDDATSPATEASEDAWSTYFAALREAGCFQGGSSIGDGVCMKKSGQTIPMTETLVGYIRVSARDLDHARSMVSGNPVFEAGGTVEVRELPKT